MRIITRRIPGGYPGIRRTVRTVAALVRHGSHKPRVRRLAVNLLRRSKRGDPYDFVRRVYDYVQGKIRYTRDPLRLEEVQAADYTLKTGAGDCDDHTVLIGSIFSAVGYPVKIHITRTGENKLFNHVFPSVRILGDTIPLDTTIPGGRPGKKYGLIREEKVFQIGG